MEEPPSRRTKLFFSPNQFTIPELESPPRWRERNDLSISRRFNSVTKNGREELIAYSSSSSSSLFSPFFLYSPFCLCSLFSLNQTKREKGNNKPPLSKDLQREFSLWLYFFLSLSLWSRNSLSIFPF